MEHEEIEAIKEKVQQMGLADIIHTASTSMEFNKLYKKLFPTDNEPCSTCPPALQAAYNKVLSYTIQKHISMTKGKYSLKKKNAMHDFSFNPIKGVPMHVTHANLTDEIAEKIISAHPSFKDHLVSSEAGPETSNEVAEGGKKVKAAELTDRQKGIAEIKSQKIKKDIKQELTDLKIPFDNKASHEVLAELLYDATTK